MRSSVSVVGLILFLISCLSFAWSFTDAHAVESTLRLDEKWFGDFDGMVEKHRIRALVPYSKTFYFLDGADQRGATYDLIKEFEKYVNTKLKKKTLTVRLIVIPTRRDRLLPALKQGLGDIAAGNLTMTPGRQEFADFSIPVITGVDEVIVTGPKGPAIETVDDLSGREIYVRASSSYYASLERLNKEFKEAGKKGVTLRLADENLEDEDLLEMLNAGLIPMTAVDSHKGEFWSQVFKDLTIHRNVKIRTGGQTAWAFRKNSPQLRNVVDEFMRKHRKGTLIGNILFNRYLRNTKWVRNSISQEEFERFEQIVELFEKYSDRYQFDWLMVAALAYQESRIDQSKRSPVGAIGVMQILPTTAADSNVGIPNIEELEPNIHAGVKYLRFITDRYFEKEPMDELNKGLFAFAGYNAGPAKVARLRNEAKSVGLDPNVWFRNVEIIAAKRIGRETVQYVSNIYKYYIAYKLIIDRVDARREEAKREAR